MQNYFYCLKPKIDEWLIGWVKDVLNNNVKIYSDKELIPMNTTEVSPILFKRKYKRSGKLGTGIFITNIKDKNKNSDVIATKDDDLKNTKHDKDIYIYLAQIIHKDYDSGRNNGKSDIGKLLERVENFFAITENEACLFAIMALWIHDDLKNALNKRPMLLDHVPTKHEVENSSDKGSKGLGYISIKRIEGMRKEPVYNPTILEEFANDIINKSFDLGIRWTNEEAWFNDIINKYQPSYDKKSIGILKLVIPFILSFTDIKNRDCMFEFDLPPYIPTKKISKNITLDVLLFSSDYYRSTPGTFPADVYDVLKEKYGYDNSTLRKFITKNKYLFPYQINGPREFLSASEESIRMFFKRYLIANGVIAG